MKKLFIVLVSAFLLLSADSFGRGGGSFGGGRSSSFSSGRSSGYSSGRSSGYSSGSSRGGSYGNSGSSKGGSYGNSGSSKGSSYGNGSSSRSGWFGNSSGSSGKNSYGNGSSSSKPVYTAKSVLETNSSTMRIGNGSNISVYHYYYPSPFYGSGYSFYRFYFWYHVFGNHSRCYHSGGGQAAPRACKVEADCTQAETCNLKTNTCQLKQGSW